MWNLSKKPSTAHAASYSSKIFYGDEGMGRTSADSSNEDSSSNKGTNALWDNTIGPSSRTNSNTIGPVRNHLTRQMRPAGWPTSRSQWTSAADAHPHSEDSRLIGTLGGTHSRDALRRPDPRAARPM